MRRTLLGIGSAAVLLCAVGVAWAALRRHDVVVHWVPELHPQLDWAPCNRNSESALPSTFRPLSDSAAAALVTREPETRPDNGLPFKLSGQVHVAMNDYVPTRAQIRDFLAARTSAGETNLKFNPYYRYVDGRDGLRDPSTDDLIQWAAHKWGVPENWLRAEYVRESFWNAFQIGDLVKVSPAWYPQFPPQSRATGSSVYESLGLTQIKWVPGGSLHPGTEPLRWLSTSFDVDYQAATIRFYYDNPDRTRSDWGDSSYKPCQQWNSIGAWYDPYPWGNAAQAQYAGVVRQDLAGMVWRSGSFLSWTQPIPATITIVRTGKAR